MIDNRIISIKLAVYFLAGAALIQAAPVTLGYRAPVTFFPPGGPVYTGDLVEMIVTYESTTPGFLYADQSWAYPVQSATVRVGGNSLIQDSSGTFNTYVIISNDATDSAGTSYMDQFMIQIGSPVSQPVDNVALILRNTSSAPSSLLSSIALPLSAPDPAQFNNLSFFVVFAGILTGSTGTPELFSVQAVPEPASFLLCGLLLALLIGYSRWRERHTAIRQSSLPEQRRERYSPPQTCV